MMKHSNRINLYKNLFERNKEKQLIVALEELSELQKEITKNLRKKSNIDNLIEEIADVQIIIEQLKYYFNIPEESVNEVMDYKLERTKKILNIE